MADCTVGEGQLVEAVAAGRLPLVCTEPPRSPEQELDRLRAAIERHLVRGPDLGLCTAYYRAETVGVRD